MQRTNLWMWVSLPVISMYNRACMIAKKWGFENVYGISAQSDPVLFIHLCVRECACHSKGQNNGEHVRAPEEKQASAKQTFVFLGPLTSKPSA